MLVDKDQTNNIDTDINFYYHIRLFKEIKDYSDFEFVRAILSYLNDCHIVAPIDGTKQEQQSILLLIHKELPRLMDNLTSLDEDD